MGATAELRVDGKILELPIVEGTEGERAIDIRKLRDTTGLVTFDPGYANTGACKSAITFIDGDKGILRYRGIPIEELAARSHFLEVAYLVIAGHLPNRAELDYFTNSITRHTMIHEDFKNFFGAMPKDAHPMAAMCGVVGGAEVPLTVYPFILRGVTLAGIDSAWCPDEPRAEIWRLLAEEWKPPELAGIATWVDLGGLDAAVQQILKGGVVGRVVGLGRVEVGAEDGGAAARARSWAEALSAARAAASPRRARCR